MLVEKIDGFDSEPGQTGIASAADILRRTVQTSAAIGSDAESEFGCHDNFVARNFAQKSSKQLFVFVRPVDFGGIEKIAAELQVAMKNLERFLVIRRAISEGHAHTAEAEGGNLYSIFSYWSKFHLACLHKSDAAL